MSRSGYSEDCEHLQLWRNNVERTIASKRGQVFIKDLIIALDAMPVKELIRHDLERNGEVCAIGALGIKRSVDMKSLDPEDPEQVGKAFGISSMLAQEIVYVNDEWRREQSPEERWTRMRRWASEQLNIERMP